ncbi:MAG: LptF/LptG family permease [Planctomycetota bacterium]
MRQRFLGLLDLYIWKVCLGSFAACLFFVLGLFVLFHLLMNVDDYLSNIRGEPGGFFLILEFYILTLPFNFLLVAPFITVTAGMFAVSRLMGANEVVPMLFTGRSLHRVLSPVFLMGVLMAVLMGLTREFVLPDIFTLKDDLEYRLTARSPVERRGRVVRDRIVPLDQGVTLGVGEYMVGSRQLNDMRIHDRRDETDYQVISADTAYYRDDAGERPGWHLIGGQHFSWDEDQSMSIDFIPAEEFEGFVPVNLRKLLKGRQELMDLSYSDLVRYVSDQPEVKAWTVALHYHLSFPLANVLLLLLALPFALRFERGSKTERVFFALLVCGAYLVIDLISRNLGEKGIVHPVVATWFPTVLFGSLGVVMFDTVRT